MSLMSPISKINELDGLGKRAGASQSANYTVVINSFTSVRQGDIYGMALNYKSLD